MASERNTGSSSLLLHRLLERQVARTPNDFALEFYPDVRLTYHEVNSISNRLARYLKDNRSRDNEVVALWLEKSHIMVIAILAVLKAGMAWVPLHLDAPSARITQVLHSCDIEYILYSKSNQCTFGEPSLYLRLEDVLDSPQLLSYATNNLDDDERTTDDLCHILFTSGSSGVPKGVMIEHRAIVHCITALVEALKIQPGTRTLQFAAPVFDVFGLDLFMTLAAGGCLVMAPHATVVADITSFMHKTAITYAQLTPTVIQLVDPRRLPKLQILASSGEALPQDLASRWRDQVRLFNVYGPTETNAVTVQGLSGNQLDAACIGRAVAGNEVCLLADQSVNEVPDGEVGEICVAGPQLFRGYLCVQVAMETPESRRNGKRFYRTGDLGQLEISAMGEKVLRCLGRKDDQLKIHGIRVDAGDIEQSIMLATVVRSCAVILPQGGSSAGRLCCIIVPEPSITNGASLCQSVGNSAAQTDTTTGSQCLPVQVLHASTEVLWVIEEAKYAATTNLPTHAIPTNWWAVKEIPLTPSGKTDRLKLRVWLEQMDQQSFLNHLKTPTTDSQQPKQVSKDAKMQVLRSLWAEVLGRPSSTIETNVSFVALGADSLDVIRFITQARKADLDLSLSQIYSARTIEALASDIAQFEPCSKDSEQSRYVPYSLLPRDRQLAPILDDAAMSCGIRVRDIEDIYPCTPYQAGLMVLDLKCPMSYVCTFKWTLPKNTDLERFRSAWNSLILNVPVLRNRLIWDAAFQAFWQVTVRHQDVDWSLETFESPMSLTHDLCRGFVQQEPEREGFIFRLKIHHSIIDGWSLRLMLNRLKEIYFEERLERPVGTPFAEYIRHILSESESLEVASKIFWEQYLETYCSQDYPPLPSDPGHEVHATGRQSVPVEVDLREMAMRYGVTPSTILHGATALVLGAHGDCEDVLFGLILAGRDVPIDEIHHMMGPAFTCVPFRTQIDPSLALRPFLQRIEQQLLDIMPYQRYGLQQIKRCGDAAAAACEFRCLIVVQPEDENLAGEGLWDKVHGQESGLADSVPLSLEFVLGGAQLLINCNFDPAYLSNEDVQILLAHLIYALQCLSSLGPQDLVSKVKLSEKDEHSKMSEWMQEQGRSIESCLHELLHNPFQQYADLVAIEDQMTQKQYTYRQLDIVSTRFSDFLRIQCGLGPEVIIALASEKSASTIVAILSILKAGGAYVPLDPNWPRERVSRILEDTGAKTILCSSIIGNKYQGLAQRVVDIDDKLWGVTPTSSSIDDKMPLATPSDLALIMYTSGSSGRPKAVMLEHRALCNSLVRLAKVFALQPGTRHLQFSSLVYDVSVADIFIPLLSGACVCVPTEDNRLSRLSLTMKHMTINSAILTPSIVDLILPDEASALNTLMTGGEMTSRALIRRWAPKVRLLNAYGPTEASITTTVTDVLSADADPCNIGRNVTGWHWIIRRDPSGSFYPAPTGCVGEIAIAGHSLARAYLHDTTLTKHAFVEAPELANGLLPSRIYLTGDLGRYRTDGQIHIIGRKDRMIKVNGIRVDPGESEHHLRQLGGMFGSCVVQHVHDHLGSAKLTAFVEATTDASDNPPGDALIMTGDSILAFQQMCQSAHHELQGILPQPYIPALFVPITRVPYTASDKVDLKRLREELEQISDASSRYSVSQQAQEELSGRMAVIPSEIALEAAFREVFALKRTATIDTHFFRQGGDSFTAIKLASAARNRGFDISVRQIYEHPRLGDLASAAVPSPPCHQSTEREMQSPPLSSAPAYASEELLTQIATDFGIEPEDVEDIYPASIFQEGLAAIALEDDRKAREHQKSTYSADMTFRIAQIVDVAQLDKAFEKILTQNPIYRTKIMSTSDGIMQVVYRPFSTHPTDSDGVYGHFRYEIQQAECQDEQRLLLSIHHTLYDAWTIDRLLEDLNHYYAHPTSTRSGPSPYKLFIDYLSTIDQEAARTYWLTQLDNAPLTPFPVLPSLSHRARATESLTCQGCVNLDDTKAGGISAATIVTAAVALLLSAYCNVDEVCYGTTLSGREEPGLRDIAGPTLSTVPIRIEINRDETMHQLLRRVQDLLIAMRQYQHYGLQNISQLPGEGGHNASRFRTLLVMQQSLKGSKAKHDGQIVQDLVHEESSMVVNYPLVVIAQIDASTGDLELRLEYDPACLPQVQASRLIKQLQQCIAQCTYPDRTVKDVELVTAADRSEILAWNAKTPPRSSRWLHHVFNEVVDRQPQHYAIESTWEPAHFHRLSYGQLSEYATRVCDYVEASFPASPLFALCFHKSPLAVISMLAIWKAGKPFVSIDSQTPASRLRFILSDLGTNVFVLTEPSLSRLFAPSEVIVLDPLLPALVPESTNDAVDKGSLAKAETSDSSSTAYIMYTSGTSGAPKGVVVSHSALATSILDVASVMNLGKDTRMLQFAAFTFDTCILEIFATLVTGGCVCMPSESERVAGGLSDAVRRLRVNQLVLTPTVAQLFQPEDIQTVQGIMLIGEAPSRHLLAKLAAGKSAPLIMNGYGPTEACVHSSTNISLCEDDASNIGRATACNMYITAPNNFDLLAAIGTIGELVICGHTLADGYLNRPDLTAQSFGVNSEWMSKSEGETVRYYRTGDLARYATNGSIIYLGRQDLQAKIHGQRLELLEIEGRIKEHGSFTECVVSVILSDLLVAFVLIDFPKQGPFEKPLPMDALSDHDVNGLRTFLRSALPAFMVPAMYVPVDCWPLTVSGKIDRRRLQASLEPIIDCYRCQPKQSRRRPQTKMQVSLAKVWAEVTSIPVDQIDLADTISALGGDSISMIRMLAGARKQLPHVNPSSVSLHSSLEAMADSLNVHQPAKQLTDAPPPFSLISKGTKESLVLIASTKCDVPIESIVDVYPCSSMQEALMMSSEKSRGAFWTQQVFRLTDGTAVSKVVKSLQVVWGRHPILRTRIIHDESFRSIQVVVEEGPDVPVKEQGVAAYIQQAAITPPGYGDRLSRCSLITDEPHTYLILSQHHAVFDGWSSNLLLKEIAQSMSLQSMPTPRTMGFSSFIVNVLEISKSAQAEQYWRVHLDRCTNTLLPQVKASSAFEANKRHVLKAALPISATHSLATIAESAWSVLLGRYTETEDVTFGTVRSGRTAPVDDIESIMGPTIVTIPRRLRPTSTKSVGEYLCQVDSCIADTSPWEQYGHQNIRKLSNDAHRACKFNSILVIQMPPRKHSENNDSFLIPESLAMEEFIRADSLTIECQPQDHGKMTISTTYDDRVIPEDDIRWISYHFSRLLFDMVNDSNKRLEDLDMTGPDDKKQVQSWNDKAILPCRKRVDELFVERANNWLDLPAIDASDAKLSYAQLDILSSRFAARLRTLGVLKGQLLPLYMTKSAAMVVAMLGSLKAGAAYVPLAIDTPRERLSLLLGKLCAQFVLCDPHESSVFDSFSISTFSCDIKALLTREPREPELPDLESQHRVSPVASETITHSDIAYIIFTSGSSGGPKGVVLDHSALATTILENGRQLNYTTGTRTLSFASYTFDVNVMEIYLTILHGGCLFIPDETRRLADLTGYIDENQIEMAFLTPTAIRSLLQSPSKVPTLKVLRAGGEPLLHSVVEQWASSVQLINSYGPTETCVDACRNPHMSSDIDPRNIGYPIATHLWVVDAADRSRLAPIGCPGELLVSGPTLARGYFNDDERTSQAFIDGNQFPWTFPDEKRLYATGDMVRQNPDGSITYLGRKDLQLKLNGFRIELEEVESAVERCDGVTAAIVTAATPPGSDSDVLVAFFTMSDVASKDERTQLLAPTDQISTLIQNLWTRVPATLPSYMVPQFYLPVQKLPLTANGKVDRKALRRTFEKCSRDQIAVYWSDSVPIRETTTIVQRILQGFWAQTLMMNPRQIGLDSDFINLGGESLAAIKLATMCREVGFRINIAGILRNTRFESMATYVEKEREVSPSVKESVSVPTKGKQNHCTADSLGSEIRSQIMEEYGLLETEIVDVYPCTPLQEALIAVTARDPQAYIVSERFRLPASVDLERFRSAWELVQENNEILRTRICSITTKHGAEMVQVVCNRPCDWIESSELGTLIAPMGLGTSLVRYSILESSEGFIFERFKHHATYDGFSTKLIWEDFRYAFARLKRPRPRPPYKQYVEYLASLDHRDVATYWMESFQDLQCEHFPALPSPEYTPRATSRNSQEVKATVKWHASQPFTFATVARAAWAIILSTRGRAHGATKDVCFAATMSGRGAPLDGLDQVTGPTIVTVPVRVKIDLDQSINQYLEQIQEQAISMLSFEHFGLVNISKTGDAAHDACKTPNLLVVQPAELEEDSLPVGLRRLKDDGEGLIESYGLVIECSQSQDQDTVSLSASHDPSLLTEREVCHLLQQLSHIIIQLNNQCGSGSSVRSAIWALVNEADFQQMKRWNYSPSVPPTCLHELVTASAEHHAERIAIDAHDGKLKYAELDVAANALAVTLQDKFNVKPGSLVPLCFEKSVSMIVAILGVLKSGAGYTALDITHPKPRMEHIIREVGAQVIVASHLQTKSRSFLVPVFTLDTTGSTETKASTRVPVVTPQDVAYITFTSGTSGPPKGVITEHGAATLSVLEHGKRYQHDHRGQGLRVLQFSAYTFDASVLDIFATLAYGGCLCIPSEEDRMGNLENVLTGMNVNFADLTPTVANLLDPSRTPTLTGLAIGGEMANRALIAKWSNKSTPLEVFVNSYGPTEASIGCAAGSVNPKSPVGSVGKPVGCSLWIVDEADHNHLVPISCVGELVISGPTLARGYLNDDKRTAAAFIEHVPWLARAGETRLYKTGDLARFDLDGNVEVLGRREDGQVKLRGMRLELGEIEAAIHACELLPTCQHVAVAKVNLRGVPALAAFIKLLDTDQEIQEGSESILYRPSERQRAIANTTENFLRAQLPEHMIPKLWVQISIWPLTASGKTDRKRLAAACEALSPATITEYQRPPSSREEATESLPMTNTEKAIGRTWREVLRREDEVIFQPQDDFFKSGGDSLSVIMLISALRRKDIVMTAQEIFATKTLKNMARMVDSKTPVSKRKGILTRGRSPTLTNQHQSWPVTATTSPAKSSKDVSARGDDASADSISSVTGITNLESSNTGQSSAMIEKNERQIRNYWATVLNRPEESFVRHDRFFECGGDALAALRLADLARQAHISFNGADIYAHPTLSDMAALLDPLPNDDNIRIMKHDIPSRLNRRNMISTLAGQTDVEDILPASHTQLAFLIEGQKWCRAYFAWSFIDIDGGPSIDKVQSVCNIVAHRHQILRTSFHLIGRQCYQAIRTNECNFKVLYHDGHPEEMCARLDRDVGHPVCFGKVLTKFRLMIDAQFGRRTLAVGLSHAQYDGFCLPIILDDFRLAHLGELTPSQTSPSHREFIKYTLQLSNDSTDQFWHESLKGCTPTTIARETVNANAVMDQSTIRIVPFAYRHSGYISYAVMLKVAWSLVLSRLSQSKDVTFLNLVSGRFAAFEGAQELIGPCLNFIPARVKIDAGMSLKELLQQVYAQQVAAIPYESTPFDRIVRQAPKGTSMQSATIFQYQNLPERDSGEDDASSHNSWTATGNATYGGGLLQSGSCWLMAWPEKGGRATFRFTYCEETLSSARVESILDLLQSILCTMNDNIETDVSSLLAWPGGENLSDLEDHPSPDLSATYHHHSLSPKVPPACKEVLEFLKSFWTLVLYPDSASSSAGVASDSYDIKPDELFSNLGGDSISAAEVASLAARSGFGLSLQDFIDFPTLALQTLLLCDRIRRPSRETPRLHFSTTHEFN